jgi:hypothetical protein
MATKAELEAELALTREQLAAKEQAELNLGKKKEMDIDTAIDILGISLVGLGGTKDKKIQAIQADIRTLTITLARLAK